MTLEALADRFWNTISEYAPTVATTRAVHDFDDQLRRFDDDWLEGIEGRFRAIAKEAERLDQSSMSMQERISARLLIHECGVWATDIEQRFFVGVIDPYLGPHTSLLSASRQNTVATAEQADALLGRYSKVADHLADALRFHRENADKGMTPAQASVDRVVNQLDGYLASPVDDDPFLQLQLPEGADADAWMGKATDLVNVVIRPGMAEYRAGLLEHLIPVARPHDKCGLLWTATTCTRGASVPRRLPKRTASPACPRRRCHRRE